MIVTKENTMLSREEYRGLADKVAEKVAETMPDGAHPILLLATAVNTAQVLKYMEAELFGEEEKK